jgi:hypothetical protein
MGIRGALAVTIAILTAVIATAQDAPTTDLTRVIVTSDPIPSLHDLVGENRQPLWTAHRRFPTTRVYVLPPWQVEFEQWWKGKFLRDGKPEHLFQSEIEIGLPYRFQLDLYENIENTANGPTRHAGTQVEGRWAFAEWGRIPLNPTLYAEWKFNHSAPDACEIKLLLGEQLAPHWQWGFNLFYEQETGRGRATKWGFSQAAGYSLRESPVSVGLEMNFECTTERRSRGDPEIEFLLGPSIEWRPGTLTHLDLVPLFGVTKDSPRLEAFLVFGIELGHGGPNKEAKMPTSARAR